MSWLISGRGGEGVMVPIQMLLCKSEREMVIGEVIGEQVVIGRSC